MVKGVLFVLAYFGYEVNKIGDFPGLGLQPGNFKVRVLILLWTGDYPAQRETGKFINGGIYPCQRDKLKGELLQNFGCQITCTLIIGKDARKKKFYSCCPIHKHV